VQAKFRLTLVAFLLCVLLLVQTVPARAQIPSPSGAQVAVGFAVVMGIGAAIGFGIYYLVRTPPSITGCATFSQNGLQLQTEGNRQTYTLLGDLASIKAGDRVRLKGKRKKDVAGNPQFVVEELSKDFGPCGVQQASP